MTKTWPFDKPAVHRSPFKWQKVLYLCFQVGALRDIKRDMAQRRNSLLKQLVHELEEWVFISVDNAKGAAGAAADAEDDEDAETVGPLIRSRMPMSSHVALIFQCSLCAFRVCVYVCLP
jgi:hypothetical protein